MKRHTIAEMKEILDAIEQGKTVQWYDSDTNTWRDFDINHGNPNFNFEHRIKPKEQKKRYRPFKDTAELFAHNNGHDILWLKQGKSKMLITEYTDFQVTIYGMIKSMDELLADYTFADGTPCGVEEDA